MPATSCRPRPSCRACVACCSAWRSTPTSCWTCTATTRRCCTSTRPPSCGRRSSRWRACSAPRSRCWRTSRATTRSTKPARRSGRVWRRRCRKRLGRPVELPAACVAVTVELRGETDVNHELAAADAEALIEYLVVRGLRGPNAGAATRAQARADAARGFDTGGDAARRGRGIPARTRCHGATRRAHCRPRGSARRWRHPARESGGWHAVCAREPAIRDGRPARRQGCGA